MSKSYLNKIELRDGDVILFHRPGAKRPVWHMRVRVRGMRDVYGNKLAYVQETTGETDLDEAKRIALDRHDRLKQRVREGAPAKELKFSDLYELWWSEKRGSLEAVHREKGRLGPSERISWYEKQSTRYWLPYFGNEGLEALSQRKVHDYWTWRIAYWSNVSDEERRRHPNHALKPSKKTLDMEQSALREIFHWVNAMKLSSHLPIIANPYHRKGITPARRPSFEPEEWKILIEYIENKWLHHNGFRDRSPNGRFNWTHSYMRHMLYCFIYWVAHTGLRPGEVTKLRWSDVTVEHGAEDTNGPLRIRGERPASPIWRGLTLNGTLNRVERRPRAAVRRDG